jgi:hypothetical protein
MRYIFVWGYMCKQYIFFVGASHAYNALTCPERHLLAIHALVKGYCACKALLVRGYTCISHCRNVGRASVPTFALLAIV